MRRYAITLALLATLPAPGIAQAAKPIPVGLWALADSPDGPDYAHNIELNLAAMGIAHRMPIQLPENGQWDSSKGNVILQQGHTYGGDFNSLEVTGRPVILDVLLHRNQGTHDGTNYHCSQGGNDCGPILNPSLTAGFVSQLWGDIQASWPNLNIVGLQLGNELFQYCPHDCLPLAEGLALYFDIWDAVIPVIPDGWLRFDGGAVVAANAKKSDVNARRLIADVHCNGKNISQCRDKVQEAKGHSSRVAILENRQPGTWLGSKADEFYAMCLDEGCIAYAQMVGRNSGNPPLSACHWGVQPNGKKNRNNVAFIGCGWVLNDGDGAGLMRRAFRRVRTALGGNPPVGTADNWTPLVRMAELAGTLDPTWEFLPMEAQGPPPPPPPPAGTPPGWHQQCAFFSVWIREVLEYPESVPNAEICKANEHLMNLYNTQLKRLGLVP